MLRLNEADGFTPHIYTMGHRNPFRMSFIGREIWEIETGWCAWRPLGFQPDKSADISGAHRPARHSPIPAQTRTRR